MFLLALPFETTLLMTLPEDFLHVRQLEEEREHSEAAVSHLSSYFIKIYTSHMCTENSEGSRGLVRQSKLKARKNGFDEQMSGLYDEVKDLEPAVSQAPICSLILFVPLLV